MTQTTYSDGIATILTRTRKTEVHVSVAASIILEHGSVMGRPSATDARALAAGFLHLERENAALREELAAARAGQVGREWAEQMQGARAVIANLRRDAAEFLEVYDRGDAPDQETDDALRKGVSEAENWLVCDVHACAVRAKILKETP